MTMYDNQSGNKPIKRPRGRPRGMRRVTHCTHGAYSKNPMEVYEYWKKHAPGIADFVDGLFNGFKRKLGWGEGHPQTEELQRLCVMMASRNIMTNNAIEKDLRMPVRDPETKNIVQFRAHHLLTPLTDFDDQIWQKLKDLGIITTQSDTIGSGT